MKHRYYSYIITILMLSIGLLSGCGGSNKNSTPVENFTPVANSNVYFMVADSTQSESYILPLSRQEDISFARKIIATPDAVTSKIVIAKIAKGGPSNYINKDLLRGVVLSWHVDDFVSFADGVIEILDGSPSIVEKDVDAWIKNTNGVIGFVDFKIYREVDPSEISSAALQ